MVIEGLFGIHSTGLDSLVFTPRLPDSWDSMALRSIKAFDRDFDIGVERKGNGLKASISDCGNSILEYCFGAGASVEVKFP